VIHKGRPPKLSMSFQEGRGSEWRTTKDVVVEKSKKGLMLFFGNKIGTFIGTAEPREGPVEFYLCVDTMVV
jgi:hypothetical protein